MWGWKPKLEKPLPKNTGFPVGRSRVGRSPLGRYSVIVGRSRVGLLVGIVSTVEALLYCVTDILIPDMSESTPGSKAVRFSIDLCHYHNPCSLGSKFQEYPAPCVVADQAIDFPIPKDLATEYPHKSSFLSKLKLLF